MQSVFTQGLRDLLLNVNAQTQAALASLNMSVQNMSSEMHRLKDQIRKVSTLMQAHAGSCRHQLTVYLIKWRHH
jgi:hypothetical protein